MHALNQHVSSWCNARVLHCMHAGSAHLGLAENMVGMRADPDVDFEALIPLDLLLLSEMLKEGRQMRENDTLERNLALCRPDGRIPLGMIAGRPIQTTAS